MLAKAVAVVSFRVAGSGWFKATAIDMSAIINKPIAKILVDSFSLCCSFDAASFGIGCALLIIVFRLG